MKPLLILIAVALSGCAALSPSSDPASTVEVNKAPKPDFSVPTQMPIDQACSEFAKTARAIAAIRDAGVPIADAPLMLKPVTEYPVGPVIREVYQRTDISPAAGAANSYQACRARSFEGMVEALKGAEAAFEASEQARIKAEYAAKKKPTKKTSPTATRK